MTRSIVRKSLAVLAMVVMAWVSAAQAAEPESKRLVLARDYIADERWLQAIDLLRGVVDDPKETRRDEALYWLAHSQNQSGDSGAAVATLNRLDREFPKSMWVKPGQSLRVDIAVKLGRTDVLWWMAAPPPRPVTATPKPPAAAMPTPKPRSASPTPIAPDGVSAPGPSSKSPRAVPPSPMPAPAPKALPPPAMWYVPGVEPDADLRIQALGPLMRTEADRAIPILAEIALEADQPEPAMRAVIVLAQSSLPKAKETVVRVAKVGPEPVRLTAVRELARFQGVSVSDDLMQVYFTADEPVKVQIVRSFGEMEAAAPLLRIIETEKVARIRYQALYNLGRARAVPELLALYRKARTYDDKHSIIIGLFIARADVQLIEVAEIERRGNLQLRTDAVQRLRLLNTPKAVDYVKRVPLQNPPEKR